MMQYAFVYGPVTVMSMPSTRQIAFFLGFLVRVLTGILWPGFILNGGFTVVRILLTLLSMDGNSSLKELLFLFIAFMYYSLFVFYASVNKHI